MQLIDLLVVEHLYLGISCLVTLYRPPCNAHNK